jgi:hypothetical protein
MDKKVILLLDGEPVEIKNALIGARMEDNDHTPFSVYAGQLEISEVGLSLLHILRAVLKINTEEMGMSLDTSENFILFTLQEAVKLEKLRRNDVTKNRNVEAFIKKYMDNQY